MEEGKRIGIKKRGRKKIIERERKGSGDVDIDTERLE